MRETSGPRHQGRAVAAVTRFGTRLSEGFLRHELLTAAFVLSLSTLVMGLTAEGVLWNLGYCAAGGAGVTASVRVLRREGPRQWLGSVGIAVGNVILLIAYGRMSGNL